MEDISPEKQSEYLVALLTPLLQQVKMMYRSFHLLLLFMLVPKLAFVQIHVVLGCEVVTYMCIWMSG